MVTAATIPLPAVNAMTEDASDQHLLARFVSRRDESAFVELVRRHSRTVWGVCRRALHRQEDAEDAFQAVFTILARKAATIRKGEAVGNWLYGVAYRTSQRAREQMFQRRQREAQARPPASEPPAWSDAACRELQRLLDEEVQRLAAKYRAPFVLCCLEGMSKTEAARELGWKEGTVSGRLAQARKLLETRLARRGVVLSAVLTATAVAQQSAAAAAPALLVQATASALVPQAGTAAASLSPQALALAQGVVHTMAATKIVAVASVVLAASVLIGGVSLAALQDNPPPPQAPQAILPPQPVPPPANGIAFWVAGGEPVLALAFSPDAKRLVTAGGLVRRGINGEQLAPGVAPRIVVKDPSAAPGAPARFLQPPSAPGHLRLWDVDSGKLIVGQQSLMGVRALALSPDGRLLATGGFDGMLQVMDAQSFIIRAMAPAHPPGCNSVTFSADGKLLATAGLDQKVKLWQVEGLKLLKEFSGHTDSVLSVAFFRHGRSIVSGSQDKSARIWDIETGTTTFALKGHQNGIETVAVSPDDKLVATASWDKTMRLWDAETGKEQAVLEGANDALFGAAFSPDGKMVAAGVGNGKVVLWDVKARNVVGTLEKHGFIVWAVAFTQDGKRLASGSSDGTAQIWDVAERKQIAALNAPQPGPVMMFQQPNLPPGSNRQRLQKEAQQLQAVRDLERAQQQLRWQVAQQPGAEGEAAKPGSKLWLLSALALGLAMSYLAFWFYVRHTRRTTAITSPAAAPNGPLPAPLVFACNGCGKRLRARAELAGKKVKCPQCGQPIPVPRNPVDLAIRPAT
jgi:RNA polymerase sigma factor (sigma-70 family)